MCRMAISSKYSRLSRYPFKKKNAANPSPGEERQHENADIDHQGEGGDRGSQTIEGYRQSEENTGREEERLSIACRRLFDSSRYASL
jgi:hypothetical protein